MKILKRHRCSCCDKMAQYKSVDTMYRNFYFCRDCKPSRGEFMLERNGFPICEQEQYYFLTRDDILNSLIATSTKLSDFIFYNIKEIADNAYFANVTSKGYVNYNKFMSDFGECTLLDIWGKTYGKNTKTLHKFYENFKKNIKEKKKNVKTL